MSETMTLAAKLAWLQDQRLAIGIGGERDKVFKDRIRELERTQLQFYGAHNPVFMDLENSRQDNLVFICELVTLQSGRAPKRYTYTVSATPTFFGTGINIKVKGGSRKMHESLVIDFATALGQLARNAD